MALVHALPDQLAAILREHRYQGSALGPCLALLGADKKELIVALLKEARLSLKTCGSANGYMTVHDLDAQQRFRFYFREACGLSMAQRERTQKMRQVGHSRLVHR